MEDSLQHIQESVAPEEFKLKQDENKIRMILSTIEDSLPEACHYKSWGVFPSKKEVERITQESEPEESQEAANLIAERLGKHGIDSWTVKVVLRDLNCKDNAPWKTAVSKAG